MGPERLSPWDPGVPAPLTCLLLYSSFSVLWPQSPHPKIWAPPPSLLPGPPAPVSPPCPPSPKETYITLSAGPLALRLPINPSPCPGTAGLANSPLQLPPHTLPDRLCTSPLPVSLSQRLPPGPTCTSSSAISLVKPVLVLDTTHTYRDTETYIHTTHTQPLSPVNLGNSNRIQLLTGPQCHLGPQQGSLHLGPSRCLNRYPWDWLSGWTAGLIAD